MRSLKCSISIILYFILLVACSLVMSSVVLADYTQEEQVTIRLNYGDQIEREIKGKSDGGLIYWKGIPYAAPPTGDNRFRGPQPVEPWDGVLDTTEFGSECHSGMPRASEEYLGEDNRSEDCLYLNVFAPKTSPTGDVPVIVYIHGGGFKHGSANGFDGKPWVEDGYDGKPVILVTMNYRLGPLGFLYHSAIIDDEQIDTNAATLTKTDDSQGNWGIRDQIKALEWVKENIEAFGGDAGNVTIMGESAGSWSVLSHMVSPLSEGLFHRAICQSQGPQINSAEHAQILGDQLLGYMGCAEADFPIECLRSASVNEMKEKHMENKTHYHGYSGWVDGVLYPDHPFKIFEEGEQHKVPLIIGYNEDEVPPISMVSINSKEDYNQAVDGLFLDVHTDQEYTAEQRETDIQEFKEWYSEERWGSYKNALARYQTDIFACQEIEVARLHKEHVSDVYMYYWHWPGYIDSLLPAMHGSEVYFLFNRPFDWQPKQLDMHLNMVKRWSKFAHDGDPWDPAWSTLYYEWKWWPFTTNYYEIYELGDRNEMRNRAPSAAIAMSDPRNQEQTNRNRASCEMLMAIGNGHFKYRWGGMKHTDSQLGVTMNTWLEGNKLKFYEEE